jgi:signal transduction histidine kinase
VNVVGRVLGSVRARITVAAAVFVLLVTGVGAVIVVLLLAHTVNESLVDAARQDATSIRLQLQGGVPPREAALTGSHDVVVQLLDRQGRVIAASGPGITAVPLRRDTGVTVTADVPGEDDTFTLVATRGTGDVGLITVGRSTEQRDQATAETAGLLAVFVPVTVIALGAIIWLSVGRALRPVEEMRREAGQISGTHLDRRLAVPPGDDELPRLAATLNAMLDRIDSGQRAQRQFVSDASHELRSPLAVIRQVAEVARAHSDRVSVAELAEDVLAEGTRLEALVTALLLLARLAGTEPDAQRLVDLDEVVVEAITRVRARGGEVVVESPSLVPVQVPGTPVLLGQLVRNLLDNAARHAHERVVVTLAADGSEAVLTVDDDGAGIPADQRERVFERFVRLDEARSRDAGGSGLGLAIVRKIAEAEGGTAVVAESPWGGARLEVRLPIA